MHGCVLMYLLARVPSPTDSLGIQHEYNYMYVAKSSLSVAIEFTTKRYSYKKDKASYYYSYLLKCISYGLATSHYYS